jgi:hypothetical protein
MTDSALSIANLVFLIANLVLRLAELVGLYVFAALSGKEIECTSVSFRALVDELAHQQQHGFCLNHIVSNDIVGLNQFQTKNRFQTKIVQTLLKPV